MEQRHKDCPDDPILSSYEDLLLFTLFSRSGAPVKIRAFFGVMATMTQYEKEVIRPITSGSR